MKKRVRIATIPAAAIVALLALNPAFADEALKPQTQQDLRAAMQDEALTVMKYTVFAQHARKEGKTALAELFERTAKDEQRHFMEEAKLSGLERKDWLSLADAIVGEYAEFSKTYAQMAERAEASGDKEAAKLFREIAAEEANHHRNFMGAVQKSLKPD